MDNETITLTLIANAGVFLEFNKTKILIDGIHSDKRHFFSALDQELLEEMLEGKGRLSNIKYLLFSHNHSDHFSPRFVIEYLKKNEVNKIFLPKDGDGKYKELRHSLEGQQAQAEFLKLPYGKINTYYFPEERLEITVFLMEHMGDEYKGVENYCFLVSIEDSKFLFLADAENDFLRYQKFFELVNIDVLFINPLCLNQAAGRAAITHIIRPKSVVVYHIPFEEDDKFGYRKLVKKDMDKYRKILPPVTAFTEPFQKLEIKI